MSLDRSVSGLKNRHLFSTGAVLIVYTEGGSSTSISNDSQGTFDESFWEKIYEKFSTIPIEKIKFISVGSKTKLQSLYLEIQQDTENHYNICLDSDYEDLHQTKINDCRVFYSYGYSWENDILQIFVLSKFIQNTCLFNGQKQKLEEAIAKYINEASEEMNFLIAKDVYAKKNGMEFIDKKRPISKVIDNKLIIDVSHIIKKDCEQLNSAPKINLCFKRYCPGHVFQKFIRELAILLQQSFSKRVFDKKKHNKFTEETFLTQCFNIFFDCFSEEKFPEIYRYYKQQFNRGS